MQMCSWSILIYRKITLAPYPIYLCWKTWRYGKREYFSNCLNSLIFQVLVWLWLCIVMTMNLFEWYHPLIKQIERTHATTIIIAMQWTSMSVTQTWFFQCIICCIFFLHFAGVIFAWESINSFTAIWSLFACIDTNTHTGPQQYNWFEWNLYIERSIRTQ